MLSAFSRIRTKKRAAECAAPANKKTSCLESPKPKKTLGASDADVAAASYSQRPLFKDLLPTLPSFFGQKITSLVQECS